MRRRASGKKKADIKGALRVMASASAAFYKDGGFHLAASMSYYALMSLIPLLFVIINVFAYFMGRSQDLHEIVLGYVRTLYPMLGNALSREIDRVVEHSRLGWVSMGIFLWLGSMVFGSLEYSMDTIFKTRKRRHFIVSTGISFGMVMISGLFMVVSFWVSYIPSFILSHQNIFTAANPVVLMTRGALPKITAFVLVFISFTSLYKLLPSRKVKLKVAVRGGIAAAALWEASKYAFAWYVVNVSPVGSIYGSFSAVIIFLLWIYYSSVILLLVAEMVHIMDQGKTS
jgi:membrane protein